MKKSSKLIAAALMSLAMFVPAQANETLTVCDGAGTSSYVPFRNIDFQTTGMHSQIIYPAEYVAQMDGEPINSVVFYLNNGLMAKDGQLVVKVGETDKAVYSSASDYCTGLTQVASMALTEGVTELVIEFDAPYIYNGGNLVIDFYAAEGGDENFYGWNAWYGLNQNGAYTAISSSGTIESFLPRATFDYGVPQDWAAKVTPDAVNFKTIRAERETVETIVVRNTGLNAFTPVFGALEAPFSVEAQAQELAAGQSMEIPVKFAPTAQGDYAATLTIDCGEAGMFQVALNASALEAANEVTVCDGTVQNAYVPTYGLYFDDNQTNAQMIYPAEMLSDMVGKEITSISFYATAPTGLKNGTFQLSLKTTEQSEFAAAEEIADMTVVATLVPDPESDMLTFTLETPFLYEGGNLAVENRVITAGNYKSGAFYGINTDYYASVYSFNNWGNEVRQQQFLPKATFLYKDGAALRGDVNGDETVNISDVTALIDMILGGEVTMSGDCTQDGNVNISDVTALIDYILSTKW